MLLLTILDSLLGIWQFAIQWVRCSIDSQKRSDSNEQAVEEWDTTTTKHFAIRPFIFDVPSHSTQTYAHKNTFCCIRKMSAFNIHRVGWKLALKQLGVVLTLIGGVLRGVACTGRENVHARALLAHSPSLARGAPPNSTPLLPLAFNPRPQLL